MTATEYVVLVDAGNHEIGLAEKLFAHQMNLLHRAFSVFIFRKNPQLELLLQQRALGKYHSAGLWTNTCCSHPRARETIIAAGERRLYEELGFHTTLRDVVWFHYNVHFSNGLAENEIDHVLIGEIPTDLKFEPNPEEIHAVRWITIPALETELAADPTLFTPWLIEALEVVKKNLSVTK